MVIHENRELNPHSEDVTRRLALSGFLALAPDALSGSGGTPTNEAQVRDLFGKLDATQTRNNVVKAVTYLQQRPDSTGRVGPWPTSWRCTYPT